MSEQQPLTRRGVWEQSDCQCEGGLIPCLKCEDTGNCSRCDAECYFPHDMTVYFCDACKASRDAAEPERFRVETARQRIKKYLLENPKGLTTLMCIEFFMHTRLAARIHELRGEGMKIKTVREGGQYWYRLEVE